MTILAERRSWPGTCGPPAPKWVFSTVLGDDTLKDFVFERVAEVRRAVPRRGIDPSRPTTSKNAIVAPATGAQKLDTLDNRSIQNDIVTTLSEEPLRDGPATR